MRKSFVFNLFVSISGLSRNCQPQADGTKAEVAHFGDGFSQPAVGDAFRQHWKERRL